MGDDPSAAYIHMVHHLIEECILFNMSKEECMEALFKHANIEPVITSTVWNELEKKNKEFFEAYRNKRRGRDVNMKPKAQHQKHDDAASSSNKTY